MTRRWPALRAKLAAAGDATLAGKYARNLKTRGVVLGVPVPVLRALVKDLAAGDEPPALADAVTMADLAFASGCREEMLVATFLLARFRRELGPEQWKRIGAWLDAVDNWENCDQLAMGVGGEIVARADGEQRTRYLRDLAKWVVSDNPWRRRFALAATTALCQKGRRDAQAVLHVCERAVADADKSVQSALAWALREACKADARAVFAFLKRHRPVMATTVLRESAKKLSASERTALGIATTRRTKS